VKIAILTNGPRAWASSRLRGYWLQDADPIHFKVFGPGDALAGIESFDAVIFQKMQDALSIERARRYRAEGKIVAYDITEPMWWWSPNEASDMMRACDVTITCTDSLSEQVQEIGTAQRVATIPDRMLPSYHPDWKQHTQHAEDQRVKFVWYGASQNRIALEGYLPMLGYLAHYVPLELRIIDDAPGAKVYQQEMGHFRIINVPFALETYHAQLTDCDIAYLPPFPGPWGAVKSNNRAITAWWAGLPVVDGFDLDMMREYAGSAEARQMEAVANRRVAEELHSIHQSAKELIALFEGIKGSAVEVHPNGAKAAEYAPV